MSLRWSLSYRLPLLLVAAAPLAAQFNLGTITGQVIDPNGGAVAAARVTITSRTNAGTRTVTTNSAGLYSAPSLPADTYSVNILAPGFEQEATQVTVDVDQTVTADFRLKVGSVNEKVQVTATSSQLELERDTSEISHAVSTQDLQDLPASGRSFISIASAGPGTGSAYDVPAGPMITFGNDGKEMVLSGQTIDSTTFLQDGVINVNLLTGTANIVSSIESIQEVSVEQNGMSARFGSPGLVNVITKRGTNAIHGMLYEYFGNNDLDARNFFALTIPPLRYNQFGANVGAPIVKNRLFAFFDYAALRQTSSAVTRDRFPTAAEEQGNFAADGVIYDPMTYNASTGAITAFPNDTIPASRISPFASKFLNFYPAANVPLAGGINYVANLVNPANQNHYIGRMDYVLSSKDTLSGQIQLVDAPGYSSQPVPTSSLVGNTSGRNAYLQETHIFSANMINIARMGYNRSILYLQPAAEGTENFVQAFGLQNLNLPADQSVPPVVSITSIGASGYPTYPMGGTQNLYQYADEVNWTIGHHQIFFGGEFDRLQFNGVWSGYGGGEFVFNGQYTSNHAAGAALKLGPGIADFLLGYPSEGVGAQGLPDGAFRSSDIAGYFQDTWKATAKLTLNFGLRYEYYEPVNDKWGNQTIYNIPANTYYHGTWQPNYKNFGPRVGYAYSVGRNTVIRSGFGIYYSTEPYQFLQYMVESPPYYVLQEPTFTITNPTPVTKVFAANPTASASSPASLGLKMPTPYTMQWNFGVQHTFGSRLLTSISYVGNSSKDQAEAFDPNQAYPENPAAPTSLASRRPYPFVGDVAVRYNLGMGTYNALQSTLQYHFSRGFSMQASYTWSRALDLSDAGSTSPVNSQDLFGSYGLANFSRTQVFSATSVYELPVGNNKPLLNNLGWFSKQVVGGWNVSGIAGSATGIPFEILATDLSNTGTGSHTQVANRVCNGNIPGGGTIAMWFNTSCFVQPGTGIEGNSGRNPLYGPSYLNFNFSAYKKFPFGEQRFVQFKAEFFNAFNHTQLAVGPQPNGQSTESVAATTYGQLTAANNPRTITLSLKVAF